MDKTKPRLVRIALDAADLSRREIAEGNYVPLRGLSSSGHSAWREPSLKVSLGDALVAKEK